MPGFLTKQQQELLDKAKEQQKQADKEALRIKVNSEIDNVFLPLSKKIGNEFEDYSNNLDYWGNGIFEDLKNVFNGQMKVFTQLENKLQEYNEELKNIADISKVR